MSQRVSLTIDGLVTGRDSIPHKWCWMDVQEDHLIEMVGSVATAKI